MRRAVAATLLVGFSSVNAAVASDGDDIGVDSVHGGFNVVRHHEDASSHGDTASNQTATSVAEQISYFDEVGCAVGGEQTCGEAYYCDDGSQATFTFATSDAGTRFVGSSCPQDTGQPATVSVITPAVVANAFRSVPVPASKLIIQPPKGRTLVNFDTNFYTEPRDLDRTVRLLGRAVQLRIHVDHWSWTFGDGEGLDTTDPGAPYPDLRITHRYLHADPVRVGLSTAYAAEWRVGGVGSGGWQPVTGTVAVASPRRSLDVVEATPVLVDHQ